MCSWVQSEKRSSDGVILIFEILCEKEGELEKILVDVSLLAPLRIEPHISPHPLFLE